MAAWPDAPTRERLSELSLGREKNLRMVGPTRWHVTLRFLGEVTDEQLGPLGEALVTGLAGLSGPFSCRLGPATAWFSRVRVLHLPAHGLDALAGAVGEATVPIVPEPGEGGPPFNGHLSLARVRGRLGPQAQSALGGIPFDSTFPVAHVDLVASEPSPQGHLYTTLVRAHVGGAG